MTLPTLATTRNSVFFPEGDHVLVLRQAYLELFDYHYVCAACLNQITYWRTKMGRAFWKTDEDFRKELHVSKDVFRSVKKRIRALPFVKVTLHRTPATTHYDIDFALLNDYLASKAGKIANEPLVPEIPVIVSDSREEAAKDISFAELLAKVAEKEVARELSAVMPSINALKIEPPQGTDDNSCMQIPPTACMENPSTNTENSPEITKKTTTENPADEVDLAIFPADEHKAVRRLLAKVTPVEQSKVLQVLDSALKTGAIRHRVGYLSALVTASLEESLTVAGSVVRAAFPSLEQRLQKQKAQQLAQDTKDAVDNDSFYAELQQRYGLDKVVVPDECDYLGRRA